MISLVTFVWSLLNTVLRGYLVKTFWAWFVLTQFPGLPHIDILAAIGFSMMFGALTPVKYPSLSDITAFQEKEDKEDKKLIDLFTQAGFTVGFLASLFMGWVVHHFMG